jgi:hypothetical protein
MCRLHAKHGFVWMVEIAPSGSRTQYCVRYCGHIRGQAANVPCGHKIKLIAIVIIAILQTFPSHDLRSGECLIELPHADDTHIAKTFLECPEPKNCGDHCWPM